MASSRTLRSIAAIGLGVILGGIKVTLPWQLFAMSIDSYQLLPPGPVEFLARTLPWFEVLLGLALIPASIMWVRADHALPDASPRRLLTMPLRLLSAILAALLLVFFSLIVRAALKGQEISCGCFGPGETISWKTMLRDGAMLAGSLFLTVMAWIRPRRSPPPEPAVLPLESIPPAPAPNLPPSESR
jgi:hypothetical protein